MTKNVDYVISFFEILQLVKRRWKIIAVFMLVFAIICGGYKAMTDNGAESQKVTLHPGYEKDMAYYDYYLETQQEMPALLKEDWKRVCYDKINNPIFSVDPFNCEYEQIIIRFSDQTINHDWTVNNWISKADDNAIFGKEVQEYSNYKNSLVVVGENKNSKEPQETVVQIIKVKGLDTKAAADYLISFFKKCSKEDNLEIDGFSIATIKGYNKGINDYQQNNRSVFNTIFSMFANSKNMNTYITVPDNPETKQHSKIKGVVKYGVFGLILGFILSVALVAFDVIRKREIISSRQIEGAFDLELLSDCSSSNGIALDVLNANLDVMTDENSKIAIITDDSSKDIVDIAAKWTKKCERTYIGCTDIFDNPKTIEALKTMDGVVIGVRFGASKLEQIQRIVLRAQKLNLNVLGYILL